MNQHFVYAMAGTLWALAANDASAGIRRINPADCWIRGGSTASLKYTGGGRISTIAAGSAQESAFCPFLETSEMSKQNVDTIQVWVGNYETSTGFFAKTCVTYHTSAAGGACTNGGWSSGTGLQSLNLFNTMWPQSNATQIGATGYIQINFPEYTGGARSSLISIQLTN